MAATYPSYAVARPVADVFQSSASPNQALTLLYYNDIHGKPYKLPHYVTAFNQLANQAKANGHEVLRLSGGDNNIGKSLKDWQVELTLMDQMGLDSSAFGNHESDLGVRNFVAGMQAAKPHFPTLISNVNLPATNPLWQLEQSGQFSMQPRLFKMNNLNVGLIGITTPDLHKLMNISDAELEGLHEQNFEQTCQVVAQQVQRLKKAGAKLIVIESHMGYALETQLAERVPGIGVIVGGHSHDELPRLELKRPGQNYDVKARPNVVVGPDGKPVYIVQAGHAGKLIGQLKLNVNANGEIVEASNQLLNVRQFPRDARAEQVLTQAYGPVQQLATFAERLDNSKAPFAPNALGQWMADTMRQVTGADIAFMRSGEIRDDIDAGPFYGYQLEYLFPFKENSQIVPMTGAQIRSALNRSARETLKRHDPHPSLLHYSGLKAEWDAEAGTVSNVYWQSQYGQWQPLNDFRTYSVVIDKYATDGREFPEFKRPNMKDTGMGRKDFFKAGLALWQQHHGNVPIQLQADNRMVIKNETPAAKSTPVSFQALPQRASAVSLTA